MSCTPHIMVAPNGARRGKSDHPALPVNIAEIATTAAACQDAGADGLHLHIRDDAGAHSLDVGRYREALAAVAQAAPGLRVQVTTEAAGMYTVDDQLDVIERLKPGAVSIAVREIARDPALASRVYAAAAAHGADVQHIVYSVDCVGQLTHWFETDVVRPEQRGAIVVLGQYAPPRAGMPDDLNAVLPAARRAGLSLAVCAFGRREQDCLLAAARAGCDLRVGFENNLLAPEGTPWRDNAAAVASLRAALAPALVEG